MRLTKIILFLTLFSVVAPLHAMTEILASWRAKYPDSKSDDIGGGNDGGCQLCHQNEGGGASWNSYGWDLRNVYRSNGNDINSALDLIENTDQDKDPAGASAFDEIEFDKQPGWREGASNTIFFKDDPTLFNQLPPSNLPVTTDYDLPNAIKNPIANSINLGMQTGLMEISGGFNSPVRAVTAPGIADKIFVVEQTGKIICVDLNSGDKGVFYDVSERLVNISSAYDERGLLGLAFHPDFQSNGLFYTYQSEPFRSEDTSSVNFSTLLPDVEPDHRSFIVENLASSRDCSSSSQKVNNVLIIDQPQSNHNGGDLLFDENANLYVSLGDGGAANDRGPGHGFNGNGRDKNSILGAILRINPLGTSHGNYSIPADNPFLNDQSALAEIYAYGFRNPYRMSFDSANGDLYTGDVGQNEIEEIDKVIIGGNYGWNWKEGSFFFYNPQGGNYVSDVAPPNLPSGLIDPVAEYDHDEGISVIGGYVYRGSEIPGLFGKYVFGDFSGANFASASGRIFYSDLDTKLIKEFSICPSVPGYITGFGQDSNNELYVLTNDKFNPSGVSGKLLKIVNPEAEEDLPPQCQASDELCVPIKASNGSISLICI